MVVGRLDCLHFWALFACCRSKETADENGVRLLVSHWYRHRFDVLELLVLPYTNALATEMS